MLLTEVTGDNSNEKYPLSNCGLPEAFGSFSGGSATSTGKIQSKISTFIVQCTVVKKVPILIFKKIYFMLLMQSLHHN